MERCKQTTEHKSKMVEKNNLIVFKTSKQFFHMVNDEKVSEFCEILNYI